MGARQLNDYNRLCIHSITTKPLSINEAAELYSSEGIKGITVWRDAIEGKNINQTGNLIRNNGLNIVSLCRGGFFPSLSAGDRQKSITQNKRIIDEAAELGAPLIVLVCGSAAGQSLEDSRSQIIKALEEILPHAESLKINLGIEPLHPMYADTRSAINTLKQANDISELFNSPSLGVVVDVFHVWWDPELKQEIARSGRNNKLLAFHLCDWKSDMEDMLNDRGLMGEGCIRLNEIREWVENSGFNGFLEVEIFSNKYWAINQGEFIKMIKKAYLNNC